MQKSHDKIIGYVLFIFIVALFAYFVTLNIKRSDWIVANCIPDHINQVCNFKDQPASSTTK